MTDEEILGIFSRNGMRIELGAKFSAKGQIAQLLYGCKNVCEILNKDAVLTPTAPDSEGQPPNVGHPPICTTCMKCHWPDSPCR